MINKSAFSFEAPEQSPGFLLWQTTIIWQRLIKKVLDKHDISHAQFVILALLRWFEENRQEVTQIEIARRSQLDKMTVSQALKKLVAMDLVMRMEDKKDTRAKLIWLTAKGRSLILKLILMVEDQDSEFFSALDENNKKALRQNLHRLIVGKE